MMARHLRKGCQVFVCTTRFEGGLYREPGIEDGVVTRRRGKFVDLRLEDGIILHARACFLGITAHKAANAYKRVVMRECGDDHKAAAFMATDAAETTVGSPAQTTLTRAFLKNGELWR